jgi:SAM-dependent methyltransferase
MDKNKVNSHYTNWVYPKPIEDMRTAIDDGYWEVGDPELYWPIFWPYRRHSNGLNILVAGCGSNQAAYYAYQNPTWNVLGIDLSEASLANQKFLKKKHDLENLRLLNLDLCKIGSLGETFDFITSTGVLHHLSSPKEGLFELRKVLRDDGVMNLMLYGKSLRLGVYVLQEFFKEIGLKQSLDDIEIVKASLEILPKDHIVHRYIECADDLSYDAGIVDTFLHEIDQAYWVKDIFRLLDEVDLDFLSWCDPGEYALENLIPQSNVLWHRLKNIVPNKAAHLYDLFSMGRGTHRFAAAHPDYVRKSKINYNSDEFFDSYIIPHRSAKVLSTANFQLKKNAQMKREQFQYEIDYELAFIMTITNSQVSIRQAIESTSFDENTKKRYYQLAKEGIEQLAKLGHVYVLK